MSTVVLYLPFLPLALAGVTLAAAAASDAMRYRIPNVSSALLLILFPLYVYLSPEKIAWVPHLSVFAIVFAVGYALYAKKLAGAGDVKLLAAASLWAGPNLIGSYLFITAIAGGLLCLALAVWVSVRTPQDAPDRWQKVRTTPIPYGIAIAIGGLTTLMSLSTSLLSPA